jgi:hypothetical protein
MIEKRVLERFMLPPFMVVTTAGKNFTTLEGMV